MATKVGAGIFAVGIFALGVYAITSAAGENSNKPETPTQTPTCAKQHETTEEPPTVNPPPGSHWVRLRAWWGGCEDATISWSVGPTEAGSMQQPTDYPCCYWEHYVAAPIGKLVLLHVTPHNAEKTTRCSIRTIGLLGKGTEKSVQDGPVQCAITFND